MAEPPPLTPQKALEYKRYHMAWLCFNALHQSAIGYRLPDGVGIIFHVLLSKIPPHWQRAILWEKNIGVLSTQQWYCYSSSMPGNVGKVAELTGLAQSWIRVHSMVSHVIYRRGYLKAGLCVCSGGGVLGRASPSLNIMTPMRPAHGGASLLPVLPVGQDPGARRCELPEEDPRGAGYGAGPD